MLRPVATMAKATRTPIKKRAGRHAARQAAGVRKRNAGAYESPVSGVGIVHDPAWANPPPRGAAIHECGYLAANRDWNFTRVFSPFWRLYYNTGPGHSVVFAGGTVELDRSRIVVIPPHRQFHCRSTRPAPSLWVHFSVSRKLAENAGGALVFRPSAAEKALAGELAAEIAKGAAQGPTDRNFRLSMALVLAVLARGEIAWSPELPGHLLKAVWHLEENLAGRPSIASTARAAGVGEARLRADFKKFHGATPGKYLGEIRVREAAAMLFHTDKSLDEIAEATGLGTRFYMGRVFKKTTGESPASYRRRHRACGRGG